MPSKRKVLVLCTGNTCRSQMAEGMVNTLLSDRWEAFSAGVEPGETVNPWAVRVMREIGIDISRQKPKSVDKFLLRRDLDLIVTVCDNARQTCPLFPGNVPQIHIGFPDPAEFAKEPEEIALAKYREVRDNIRQELIERLRNFN